MIRRTMVAFFAIVLFVGSVVQIQAQAQRPTYRGTYRSVRQLILRIENRTKFLRNSVIAQGRSADLRSDTENLDAQLQDLKTTVPQLRARFERRVASAADTQQVLNRAVQSEQFVGQRVRGASLRNWTNLPADLNQLASVFRLAWPPDSGSYRDSESSLSKLTGTYRLDPMRSDDPTQAADRAVQSAEYRDRVRLRDEVAARLESPDKIAIELRGREVTLASSRAPQITFSADGIERVDTTNGQSVRARATLNGDQLIVTSISDAGNQFNVTFDPIDNARSLSVNRKVYVAGLSRPVTVQSVYQKTSEIAQFEINPGPQPFQP